MILMKRLRKNVRSSLVVWKKHDSPIKPRNIFRSAFYSQATLLYHENFFPVSSIFCFEGNILSILFYYSAIHVLTDTNSYLLTSECLKMRRMQ